MRVRAAVEHDEPAVLDVLRADGAAAGRQPSKARLQQVRDLVRSPTALTLVADEDGDLPGVLVAVLERDSPGVLRLSLLCVRPEDRRQGVGAALLHALLARFPAVTAWAPPGPLRALLEGCGFRATGRTRDGVAELEHSVALTS